jgi:hypothetical protein
MNKAFSELLRDLESEDMEVAKRACSDAALLLERHVSNRYDDAMFDEFFGPGDLLDVRFDDKSYDEVIIRLLDVLDRRKACADVAAWAAGKTCDIRLRGRLLDTLRDHASIEEDNLVYQTIIALENFGLDEEVVGLLGEVSTSARMIRSAERAREILSLPPEVLRLKMQPSET